jgi:WD40 repeat protein
MKPAALICTTVMGVLPAAFAADLDFYKDVYPFLKTNCISCHNKTTTKARLNMESPELMIKGGDSGPAVVPGNGAESLVVQASVHTKDMEMPPPNNKSGASNLKAAEIATLKRWIDQGAKSSVKEEHQVLWQPLAPGVHPIYAVAMTKDGRYAACGRSNQVYLYDLATRQLVGHLGDAAEKDGAAHRGLVQSLAFSPDGMRLASGSFREVKIWKLESAKAAPASSAPTPPPAAPLDEKLAKQITSVMKASVLNHAKSADGKQVATGCSDGLIRVWDAVSGKLVNELKGSVQLKNQIAALELTIAAQTLEQSFQKSVVTKIEAQNKSLDELLKKANEAIVAMNKVLPEKQKALAPAREAKAAAEKAVSDAKERVAKAPNGKPDAALEKELKDAQEKAQTVGMTEISALAAVSAAESNIKDAQAEVTRITESKTKNGKDLAAANDAISRAAKTQEKATTDLTAARLAFGKGSAKPLAVTFSPDARRVAALFDDGALRVWAVESGTPLEESNAKAAAGTTLAAAPDGSFTAVNTLTLSTGTTPHWVLERTLGGEKAQGVFADRVNALRFSPDGKLLATGGGEPSRTGDVTVFDVTSGKAVQTWKERHTDTVLSLDFSPDGKLLASGAADKIAKVTEVATGKQVNLFEGHTHHVMGVAFRSDGRILATAGADGVVMIWDMLLGERKKKIEGWTKEVTSLQFIGATNQIVTSAGDNRVRIVTDEGAEVRSMANLPDYMQASVSNPTGDTVIAGGEDSVLRMWDGTNGKELAVFGMK